jgi:hypothetical protein
LSGDKQADFIDLRPDKDGSGDVYHWDAEKGEWVFAFHYDETHHARVFDGKGVHGWAAYDAATLGDSRYGEPTLKALKGGHSGQGGE